MKVLLAAHVRRDREAGAAGSTLRLGDQLSAAGAEVRYAFYDDVIQADHGPQSNALLFPWALAAHVARLNRTWSPDLIDVTLGNSWVMSRLNRIWGRFHTPRIVGRSHGLEHRVFDEDAREAMASGRRIRWRGRAYHGGYRLWEVEQSIRLSDAVIVTNSGDSEYIRKYIDGQTRPTAVIPEFIAEHFFDPHVTRRLSQAPIRIIFLGSWLDRKGIRYMVPALEKLYLDGECPVITFAGTGVDEDRVRALLPSRLASKAVIKSRISSAEVAELLDRHDILLLPSLAEGNPLSVAEAMARGLAIVGTNAGGIPDVVEDGVNGFIVPTRDAPAISAALRELDADRKRLLRMQQESRARAEKLLQPSELAKRTLDVYDSVFGGH